MILPDVNVLVYAFRPDVPLHERHRAWLESRLEGDEPIGFADSVLAGVARILTHPRILQPPERIDDALDYVEALRAQPIALGVSPGPRHWTIFSDLCRRTGVKGNLVPDAYLAALAIESGAELITTDRDFSRFRGLRWRHPLDV